MSTPSKALSALRVIADISGCGCREECEVKEAKGGRGVEEKPEKKEFPRLRRFLTASAVPSTIIGTHAHLSYRRLWKKIQA